MKKPVIGISAGFSYLTGEHFLNRYYTFAICHSGGLPLILPAEEYILAQEYYDLVDGLIFSGGGDLDPIYLAEEPLKGMGEINPLRDTFEWELAQIALKGVKPILGICRGMQLLNIAAGGSIYQDVQKFTLQEHNQKAPKWHSYHSVQICPNSQLYQITGQKILRVNSFHHQAVCQIGSGLQVVARSQDNLIEAFEGVGLRKILGVQWHPECSFARDMVSRKIFGHFVDWAVGEDWKDI